MSAIATLLSILNGAWALLSKLFGKKPAPDENTQAVEVANRAGALSADEARAARANTEQELAANEAQTDADVAAVRDAGGLQDGADAVNRAIARTRSYPGTDR
ncbi:hypothetical protein [Burkholderia glumae]|uniref:hypothetical protein n=1 Tax=Burkholderia glumae TaxID=337 RepID=UPI00031EF5C8|nr:hypothetical protein [Burkholderia glumae]